MAKYIAVFLLSSDLKKKSFAINFSYYTEIIIISVPFFGWDKNENIFSDFDTFENYQVNNNKQGQAKRFQ